MLEHGEAERAEILEEYPDRADEWREVVITPPRSSFAERATIDIGGRSVDLRYLGRGHTDGDIVVVVPDAAVLFAGDLLENGSPPWFGDGYPLDWPATAEAILALTTGAVAAGHGEVGDRSFVERQLEELREIANLGRSVAAGDLSLETAVTRAPYRPGASRAAIERAAAQARGELDWRMRHGPATARPGPPLRQAIGAGATTLGADPDDPATPRLAGEDGVECRLERVQRHFGGRFGECARAKIGRQPVPQPASLGDGDSHRIDAEERDRAEDERKDGRGEGRPAGIAARGDPGAALEGAEHVRQGAPPTLSIAPAHRSVSSGRALSAVHSSRETMPVAPSPRRYSCSASLPVAAQTS